MEGHGSWFCGGTKVSAVMTPKFPFDEMINELHPDEGGVDAIFDRAAPRRFDRVMGADGIHSGVRRLAVGRKLTSSSLSACMSPRRNFGFPWNATTR
jgi:2-polyprenyl-6-methoxyphenol hydroxylase-like FAD-dependent oxidoreductase